MSASINSIENAKAPTNTKQARIDHRCFDEIQAEAVTWLWSGRIPTKLVVIAGMPGKGKSQVTIAMAATVSTGGRWPDGTPCEQGSVIFIAGEDDPADTVKPRLEAAGADTSKVHVIDSMTDDNGLKRHWTMADSEPLADLCAKLKSQSMEVRLIVIDPITAYVGKKDGHNTSDVRGLLAPLMTIADQYKITIMAVSHLNKSVGGDAVSRVTGSGAFVAASRAALLVADHPDIDDAQIIATLKTNLTANKSGFGYRIKSATTDDGIPTSCIEWIPGSIEVDADELLMPKRGQEDLDANSAKSEAAGFLMEILANGPIASVKVYEAADEAGIAERTLKRAKSVLLIKSIKIDGKPGWHMQLPAGKQGGQVATPWNPGPLGPLGPLDEGNTTIPLEECQECQEGQEFNEDQAGTLELEQLDVKPTGTEGLF